MDFFILFSYLNQPIRILFDLNCISSIFIFLLVQKCITYKSVRLQQHFFFLTYFMFHCAAWHQQSIADRFLSHVNGFAATVSYSRKIWAPWCFLSNDKSDISKWRSYWFSCLQGRYKFFCQHDIFSNTPDQASDNMVRVHFSRKKYRKFRL